ncbi:uncharacterized protein LOC113550389 [Rhopalosiphum maidis]|uniref:uncharacterized protein LOC113550389 n=1 Tax=Rhopalosiphum maidis TaxID=43146 RepID=UPI000EFE6C53|nr:uncharacterized protein LOC113550389 [Rhopalosiphum maidis]XP_026807978.1 uncharacterized protein LOC113550389 [Rhopalosiphum maidis]XP_026807979.1 uncharacterized protein LOC113550389 [Rhopalosiphum maidis]XP_026807980.1 uncharacterized protein LOC113550389 [Rhopalosiphum maidis]XP_026807981.1 uncharacterized protein LOC113550389 [Rhopalosiphum maidis]
MCLIRDNDDNCERFVYPLHILDTIDLTLDEMGDDDDFIEITQRGDLWNYPYNLLPSSDEEEPARGFIDHIMEDNNEDILYASSITTHDSSNEINQNASSASANINILETNDTDHSSEEREFELNIPQILLSMSRISNNLYNLTSASHD